MIRTEDENGDGLDHLRQPEKQDERKHLRIPALLQTGHDRIVERIADHHRTDNREQNAEDRIDVQIPIEHVCAKAAKHDELPMRQIDHAHDAEHKV